MEFGIPNRLTAPLIAISIDRETGKAHTKSKNDTHPHPHNLVNT